MKKLWILLFLCFGLTGCYDYQELNNNYIVSGIAIDKKDGIYQVIYEMIDSTKSEVQASYKAFLSKGEGKSLAEAFQQIQKSLAKEPTLSHVKVLFFGEELAKEGMLETLSTLAADYQIHNTFYPILVTGPIDSYFSDKSDLTSILIQEQIDYNENSSFVSKQTFSDFLASILDSRQDAIINVMDFHDKRPSISRLAIFSKDQLASILSPKDSSLLQSLKHSSNSFYYDVLCSKGHTLLNVSSNKEMTIRFSDQDFFITSYLNGTIIDDTCDYNFRSSQVYDDLVLKSKELLSERVQTLFDLFSSAHSDVLGLQKDYYQKTKKDLENWESLNGHIEFDIHFIKNGFLFERS